MPMRCSNVDTGTLRCQWAARIEHIVSSAREEKRLLTEEEIAELRCCQESIQHLNACNGGAKGGSG